MDGPVKKEASRPIRVRADCNYVAFFLTLACNLKCPWCINRHGGNGAGGGGTKRRPLGADEWIAAANRLVLRDDLPLTCQGGEPTLHKGFFRFVNEVKAEIAMDLLTNLMFDVKKFIANVPPWRFSRKAPYAPIRVSYHPGYNDIDEIIGKTRALEGAGFRVGVFGILHPDPAIRAHILAAQKKCLALGVDFRTKEFLGEYRGTLYGTFKYEGSVCGGQAKICECRTTELIVDPCGDVYRCHADLYGGREPVGQILDGNFTGQEPGEFRPCRRYGDCNPCDVKVKTNRLQIFGHTSVEIRDIR